MGRRGGRGSQLGLRVGLASVLSLTRHSLDLRLARDLQLGREAREPQSPSMEGVGSFPAGTERDADVAGGCGLAPQPCRGGGDGDGDHLSGRDLGVLALLGQYPRYEEGAAGEGKGGSRCMGACWGTC